MIFDTDGVPIHEREGREEHNDEDEAPEGVRLSDFVAEVMEHERAIRAPAPQTPLWDEFLGDMERTTGVNPLYFEKGGAEDVIVPPGVVEGWRQRYATLAATEHSPEELRALLRRIPREAEP